MAEDIKYTVAEMEQLAKTVEKLKGEFGKDFEQVFTNINVLLKEWNKSFGMGTSEMEELLSISDELREKHDQMVDLGKKYAAELEKQRGPIIAPRVLGIDEKHIVHALRAVFIDIETGVLLEMKPNNMNNDIIETIE